MVSSILALGLFVGFVLSPVFFVTVLTVVHGQKRRRQTRAHLPVAGPRPQRAARGEAVPAAA